MSTRSRYACHVAWPITGTANAKPAISVSIDSAIAAMTSAAQNAIAPGFSPTARTLVRIARRSETRRSSSSGTDTAVAANTTAAPSAPASTHSGNTHQRDITTKCRRKSSSVATGASTKFHTSTTDSATQSVAAIASQMPSHTSDRVPCRHAPIACASCGCSLRASRRDSS